jgi:hypothetical protein
MYPLLLHANLTIAKWSTYSIGQQILMIANELNRAGNWIEKGQNFETNMCYERAFELIDLTKEDVRWKGHLRELCRMREILGELYIQNSKDIILNKSAYDALISMSSEAYNLLNC